MHTNDTNITKLRQLAGEVRNYQVERGWSDTKLCKEIASVGSSKTYKAMLDPDNDLSDYDLGKQLKNFLSAVEVVAAMRLNDRPPEVEYPHFENCRASYNAVRRVLTEDEECVARLIIIEGATATGKDCVRRHLTSKYQDTIIALDANALWDAAPTTGLLAIYHAIGIKGEKVPSHPRDLLASITAALNERKRILLINEAHHMGLPGLNMVKTIINSSPTIVVLEWIPVGGTRLLGKNYEEAIQLTGNRMAERVVLPSPPSDEIEEMMDNRGVKFQSVELRNSVAKILEADAPIYGNWRMVIQVTRILRDASKRGLVTQKTAAEAIRDVKSMRTRIIQEQKA